jgi:cytochrome d ubiquinol oxidase subunit II
MHLSDLWFIAIAVLWAGYFVLEGFDFGVGILLPVLGRNGGKAARPGAGS